MKEFIKLLLSWIFPTWTILLLTILSSVDHGFKIIIILLIIFVIGRSQKLNFLSFDISGSNNNLTTIFYYLQKILKKYGIKVRNKYKLTKDSLNETEELQNNVYESLQINNLFEVTTTWTCFVFVIYYLVVG
ncbi:hypothetical protein HYU90_03035 [Candidatus Collierbacteria bacterium]|nr:hypothetical protein [Candidatus Collierbacteria bacterium]